MDIRYPSPDSKDLEERSFGQWIKNQRTAYKNGKLSQDKVKKLEQWPGWVWSRNCPDGKKEQLLEMAQNGEPRPIQKSSLGRALCSYTNRHIAMYDADFDKQIRKLAPSWFVNRNNSESNKEQLLAMARNGKPRLSWKTPLGRKLISYLNKCQHSYDSKFDQAIRKLAPPSWFLQKRTENNKEQLLEMAQNGEPRPNSKKNSLGRALIRYTNQSKSNRQYDPAFDKRIRRLAPHWFSK